MIRTSQTDPIRVDWLPEEFTAPGRVGLTFAPGKHADSLPITPFDRSLAPRVTWRRDLRTDLRALRDMDADVLITLVEDHELGSMKIPELFDEARALGISSVRLPIRDVDVPRDPAALRALLEKMHVLVEAGRSVVVHCAGGLGRTGVVAGCFLVSGGMPPEEALRFLVRARGPQCPETIMQRSFIRGFARTQKARERRRLVTH